MLGEKKYPVLPANTHIISLESGLLGILEVFIQILIDWAESGYKYVSKVCLSVLELRHFCGWQCSGRGYD
jgi:hypothetical protein